MTAHLSPAEFVDLTEGTLEAARASHVEVCTACRAQAADLTAMVTGASAVQMPEPSPLFWNHFSARVSAAVQADTEQRSSTIGSLGAWSLRQMTVGAVVLAVAFSGVWMARDYRTAPRETGASANLVASADSGLDGSALTAPADLTAWDVLTSMAEEVPLDDAHADALSVPRSTIDAAVQGLSQDERNELGRLLQDEMKHASE